MQYMRLIEFKEYEVTHIDEREVAIESNIQTQHDLISDTEIFISYVTMSPNILLASCDLMRDIDYAIAQEHH